LISRIAPKNYPWHDKTALTINGRIVNDRKAEKNSPTPSMGENRQEEIWSPLDVALLIEILQNKQNQLDYDIVAKPESIMISQMSEAEHASENDIKNNTLDQEPESKNKVFHPQSSRDQQKPLFSGIPSDALITIRHVSRPKSPKPDLVQPEIAVQEQQPFSEAFRQTNPKKDHRSASRWLIVLALILLAGALFTFLHWPSSHPVSVPSAEQGKVVT
jgi:hypothetical protein